MKKIRPWHRDVILYAGVLCLLISAFMVGIVVGFLVLGIVLVQASLQLAPDEEENPDGS